MKKLLSLFLFLLTTLGAGATEIQDVIWQGSNNFHNWQNGISYLTNDKYDWTKIPVGSTLKVYFVEDNASTYWQLKLGVGSDWSELNEKTKCVGFNSGDSEYSYQLTQDDLNCLKEKNGLTLSGCYITVTHIILVHDVTFSLPFVIEDNRSTIGSNWGGIELDKSIFSNILMGEQLNIHYTVAEGAQIKVATKADTWPAFLEDYNLSANGVKSFVLNTKVVSELIDNGMAIQGKNITITKVEVGAITKGFSATGYASFSAPYPVTVPEGVKVGVAKVKDNEEVEVTYVEASIIPAHTGVILKDESKRASVAFAPAATNGEASLFADNELVATSLYPTPAEAEGIAYYGLKASAAEFAQITAGTNFSCGKAYLKTNLPAGASSIRIVETTGESTAIDQLQEGMRQMDAYKYIHNGRLTIVKGDKMFNLNGQEIK